MKWAAWFPRSYAIISTLAGLFAVIASESVPFGWQFLDDSILCGFVLLCGAFKWFLGEAIFQLVKKASSWIFLYPALKGAHMYELRKACGIWWEKTLIERNARWLVRSFYAVVLVTATIFFFLQTEFELLLQASLTEWLGLLLLAAAFVTLFEGGIRVFEFLRHLVGKFFNELPRSEC